jgi:hypothetical protein
MTARGVNLRSATAIVEWLESLHDCPFDLAQARFDDDTHAWSGRFLRPVWDGAEAQHRRRAWVTWESRLPVMEVRVSIHQAARVRVLEDQGIRLYTFTGARRIGSGGLRLDFNERLKIEIASEHELTATAEEVAVTGIRAVYRQWLFVQTGPALEFLSGTSSSWAQ